MHTYIWSIGNNHTMDAGREGVISTRKIAAEMGCKTIGAGLNEVEDSKPVYLGEVGGIGMFCVSYMNACIPATASEPGLFLRRRGKRRETRQKVLQMHLEGKNILCYTYVD